MTLIDIDNFRYYFGQSPNQYIYSTNFDTTKVEVMEYVDTWEIHRDNNGHDYLYVTVNNPNNYFQDATYGRPIDFSYGVEFKYITSQETIDEAESGWTSQGGAQLGTPTADKNILVEGTASQRYDVTGTVNAGTATISKTSLSVSIVSGYSVEVWIRSSTALDAADLSLKTYSGSYSLEETLDSLNDIKVNEWTRLRFEDTTKSYTMTRLDIYPNATPTWTSGDKVYIDKALLVKTVKTIFKGELNPIDFNSGAKKNMLKLYARGAGKYAMENIMSRDYLAKDFKYIEDIIIDIVDNLTSLGESTGYNIDIYAPVSGSDVAIASVDAGDKHIVDRDFRFRNVSPNDAIEQLCTYARIGYYFHADATTGGLRLTLKSRSTDTADHTITADNFHIGKIKFKEYNDNTVSRVIVVGKDGISATQTNKVALDAGYTTTKVLEKGGLTTVHECAEAAHYEIIKNSSNDDIIETTLNPNNTDIGDDFLFVEPYDVFSITDNDVGLSADKYNIVTYMFRCSSIFDINATFGDTYKTHWLRFYEMMQDQEKDSTMESVPIHYRTTAATIDIDYNYHTDTFGTDTTDVTSKSAGRREMTKNISDQFIVGLEGSGFRYALVKDGANFLQEKAEVLTNVVITLDDSNKLVRTYLGYDWTNPYGVSKDMDYVYPVIEEVTELTQDITKGDNEVVVRSAVGGNTANKPFTISYRNEAKVVWVDGNNFAIDADDYDIFLDGETIQIQYADGTTDEIDINMSNAEKLANVIERDGGSSGGAPTVGSTVYVEGTEECYVSSISYTNNEDTITIDTAGPSSAVLTRAIQAGAKVYKYFITGFENDDALTGPVTVTASSTETVYFVVLLTSDTTTSSYNKSYVTKEGLLYIANQIIAGPDGNGNREENNVQKLYGAIGDSTTALSYDWSWQQNNTNITMELDGAWGATYQPDIVVGSDTVHATPVPSGGQTTPTKFKAATLAQADDYWNNYEVVFTSGNNDGERRKIIDWTQSGGVIEVGSPWPSFPDAGDSFYIEPPIQVGDYIYYDSGDNYDGVSGSETKTMFLKVLGFTGGPPKTTIEVEANNRTGTIATGTSITLIANGELSSEINRINSSVAGVLQGDTDSTYHIKIVTDISATQSGEATSSGAATGEYTEITEAGVFTEDSNIDSDLQYYLGDVSWSNEEVALGYGDDPYNNMTQSNAVDSENNALAPRSVDMTDAYNICYVSGSTGNQYYPIRGYMLRAGDLTSDVNKESLEWLLGNEFNYSRVVPGSALNSVYDGVAKPNAITGWGEAWFYGTYGPGLAIPQLSGGADSTNVATIVSAYNAIQIYEFVIPREFDAADVKKMTFHWAGVASNAIETYIWQQSSREWVDLPLKSSRGFSASNILDNNTNYFYGKSTKSDDMSKTITTDGKIFIMLVSYPLTGEFGKIYTDFAFANISTDKINFNQGSGKYRKGIDYYYDRTNDPEYIWWDYVDPIEHVDSISSLEGVADDRASFILVPSNLDLYVKGDYIYLENSVGTIYSTVVLEKYSDRLIIDGTSINEADLAVNDKIYLLRSENNKKIDIHGKTYHKDIPNKTNISDSYPTLHSDESVSLYEGFENGGDGDTVSTDNTNLNSVTGTVTFDDTYVFGPKSDMGAKIDNGEEVRLTASTTTSHNVASVDVYTTSGGAGAGVSYVALLNSSGTVKAGLRFSKTNTDIEVYDGTSWQTPDPAFIWQHGQWYNITIMWTTTEAIYFVNGIAISETLTSGAVWSASGATVASFSAGNSATTINMYIDNMYVGRGPTTKFVFKSEGASSFAEATHNKRGFLQYAPSELVVVDGASGDKYSSLNTYIDGGIVRAAVIEYIDTTYDKIHLSIINTDRYSDQTDITSRSGGMTPFAGPIDTGDIDLDLDGGEIGDNLNIICDARTPAISHHGVAIGDTYYGAAPAWKTFNTGGGATKKYILTSRFANFKVSSISDGASDWIVELWTGPGDGAGGIANFGYLSGYMYIPATPQASVIRTMMDTGSDFFEPYSFGHMSLYKIDLSPAAADKYGELYTGLKYSLLSGDSYMILDEEYQPITGIPKVQTGMVFGLSVGNNPADARDTGNSGDVQYFQVDHAEMYPRQSTETWYGYSAPQSFNDTEIIGITNSPSTWTGWKWDISIDAACTCDLEEDLVFRSDRRIKLYATNVTGRESAIVNRGRIADRQTVRIYFKVDSENANCTFDIGEASGSLNNIQTRISSGMIQIYDGNGAAWIDIYQITATTKDNWFKLDIELDYNRGARVYYEILNTTTSGSSDWYRYTFSFTELKTIKIAADGNNSNATTLYVGDVSLFGGDTSGSTKTYVHLADTSTITYTTSNYVFKYMSERGVADFVWVNPYVGLKQGHKADISMLYQKGANYTVTYAKGHGVCLVRSLLSDISPDSPIKMRAGEKTVLTQDIQLVFT